MVSIEKKSPTKVGLLEHDFRNFWLHFLSRMPKFGYMPHNFRFWIFKHLFGFCIKNQKDDGGGGGSLFATAKAFSPNSLGPFLPSNSYAILFLFNYYT